MLIICCDGYESGSVVVKITITITIRLKNRKALYILHPRKFELAEYIIRVLRSEVGTGTYDLVPDTVFSESHSSECGNPDSFGGIPEGLGEKAGGSADAEVLSLGAEEDAALGGAVDEAYFLAVEGVGGSGDGGLEADGAGADDGEVVRRR
mmetsp:Transcript_14137/g.20338  ORF Transcript_14137/g.20338 Transcript_14137/m.20338 type:complete len:151 (+) Transcript_14137:1401-1853(+)